MEEMRFRQEYAGSRWAKERKARGAIEPRGLGLSVGFTVLRPSKPRPLSVWLYVICSIVSGDAIIMS